MKDNTDSKRLDKLVTEYIGDDNALGLDELIEMDELIDKLTDVSEHGGVSRDTDV